MKQDDMIKEEILNQLWNNFDNGDLGISIQLEDGYVKLHGIVDTLSEKEFAGKLIRGVSGVKGLDNSLSVSMDGTIDDQDVSDRLRVKLRNDKLLQDAGVEVKTHKGIVTFYGQVSTLEKAKRARELAGTVMGVKEVVSNIKVNGDPDLPDDATQVNNVEAAFAASGEVQAEDIQTSCRKGVIYLEGTVATGKQRDVAAHLANTVPGVQKVVNHLTTREEGIHQDGEHANNPQKYFH